MVIYQKNLLCGSTILNKLYKFFAFSGATIQDNKAPNIPSFTILGSPSLDSGPALVIISLFTEELFKQFIQIYMETVKN